jgi:putative hydrolase of the HAD superfamily
VSPRLDAVVFDAGGTLVRLDFEWMSETVTALGFPLATDVLRRAEVEGRRRYDASLDAALAPGSVHPLGARGDIRAYFGGMLEKSGVPAGSIPAALEAFEARHRTLGLWTRPVEGARAAIDAIAALGLRQACVSNSDGRAESHLVDCGVRDGLEFVVDSEIVGVEKPDPRIFHIALARLGVAAERSLYVGDILSVDSAGARAAGMHFVLLDPAGDYAPPGVAGVRSIDRLPGFITQVFDVRGLAPGSDGNAAVLTAGEAAPAPNRAVP